jgi:GT2 family glycosyltransferase
MITYVIPTRDRSEHLRATLRAISNLGPHDAEVVIIDNASPRPVTAPARLDSGLHTRIIRLDRNMGAAARNVGVQAARHASDWAVMLDDDSYPLDLNFLEALASMPADVAAVSADIRLPDGRGREQGGLPEVFIGCGAAVRLPVFVALRGYDEAFGYYAEEYDLAARILLAGYRVVFEPTFRVEHAKAAQGRDMSAILSRLVRNNGWTIRRYAPESELRASLRLMRRRYLSIARKEHAEPGWAQGARELRRTIRDQPRRPMPLPLWDRFTGLAHAREGLRAALASAPFRTATIVDRGKHDHLVERALAELGVRIVDDGEARVIGTLSPGPMLDALERRRSRGERVVAPWPASRGASRLKAA